MCRNPLLYNGHVTVVGNLLVFRNGCTLVAIWKLPKTFVEICSRHLEEDIIGRISECDQLIQHDDTCSYGLNNALCWMNVDRYGVTAIRSFIRYDLAVVYLLVHNSII